MIRMLSHIRDHLFDPGLDVNGLKRACGIRDNSAPIRFHSLVGSPPRQYIEDRRFETACKLLVESNLRIWQIAQALGYSSIQVFSRAFGRWAGERPTAYQRLERRRQPTTAAVKAPPSPERLRQAAQGLLEPSQAQELIEHLQEIYVGADAAADVGGGCNG